MGHPRYPLHQLVKQDLATGEVVTTTGEPHLRKTMAIQSGHLLPPPLDGVYVDVPLKTMLNVSRACLASVSWCD